MHRRAFSLLELAIVLGISAGMIGFLLKIVDASTVQDCYMTTRSQLMQTRDSIERFAIANNRFPVPARRNVGVESPTFGREVSPADIPTELNSVTNADTSVAVFGALPFQALGLSSANAADCWGNKLTYVVTKNLTDATKFVLPATAGAITIKRTMAAVVLSGAGYAIISHGADGLGAAKNNYAGVDRKWCTADATIRTQNCQVSTSVLVSTQFNNGKDAAANFFDDLIVYRGPPWINTH